MKEIEKKTTMAEKKYKLTIKVVFVLDSDSDFRFSFPNFTAVILLKLTCQFM